MRPEYFDAANKEVFNHVINHIEKYNTIPTKESLLIDIQNGDKVNSETLDIVDQIGTIDEKVDEKWLYKLIKS